jgi:hypothetical protein
MCDVLNPDGSPHETNTRAKLVELLTPDVVAERPLYGFEQARFNFYCCPIIVAPLAPFYCPSRPRGSCCSRLHVPFTAKLCIIAGAAHAGWPGDPPGACACVQSKCVGFFDDG